MGHSWGDPPSGGKPFANSDPSEGPEEAVSYQVRHDRAEDLAAAHHPAIDLRSPGDADPDERPALDRLFDGEADPSVGDPEGLTAGKTSMEAPDA